MKVKNIKSGDILDVNASYGTRLIEQGRATMHKEDAPVKEKTGKKTSGDV